MAMQAAISDEQITALVPRCQRGEAAAVEALYDLYADRVYRYLLARVGNAEVAADLSTEVFVRLIQHIGRFRLQPERPAASFSAWLYRVAANLAADHHRTHRRMPEMELADDLPLTANLPGPQQVVEQRETLAWLSQAMNSLSEDQRLVLIGKFGEEMSNAEVAAWLGKTEGAVKSLQHRGLRALARLLDGTQKTWT
jgi:RNA polymerase sigma-70 factor (ECF subfamily)